MTKIDITKYKAAWEERARRESAENEAARAKAVQVAQSLTEMLVRNYPVRKVILYGSVIEPGRFKKTSDIDIAVEGLPKKHHFEALALLMEASPFEVDLKPIEEVSELLRQRMVKGKVLYEKGTTS
ncbi:MAG: nucleotidyltransferase domain-containing protein [Deltaproteobacteria bacterium]|nr:MAG: nucleotidyltransferase domain-containing protein [Deltaproteobacteria bacterium]